MGLGNKHRNAREKLAKNETTMPERGKSDAIAFKKSSKNIPRD